MEAEIREYFKKRYAESPVRVVPGHWPQFKTKKEVDDWISELNMVDHFIEDLLQEKKKGASTHGASR